MFTYERSALLHANFHNTFQAGFTLNTSCRTHCCSMRRNPNFYTCTFKVNHRTKQEKKFTTMTSMFGTDQIYTIYISCYSLKLLEWILFSRMEVLKGWKLSHSFSRLAQFSLFRVRFYSAEFRVYIYKCWNGNEIFMS